MMSDYAANKSINAWLRAEPFIPPPTVYLALLKQLPSRSEESATSEVSGGDYARVAITFSEAADQYALNDELIVFEPPTEDWATEEEPIIAVAIMDAEGGGPTGLPPGASEGSSSSSDGTGVPPASGGHWLWAGKICPLIVLSGDQAPEFQVGAILAAITSPGGC